MFYDGQLFIKLALLSSHCICVQFGGSSFPIRITKGAESTDDNEDEDDIEELERKLKGAALPEHALKVAMKEIKVSSMTGIWRYVIYCQ